MQTNRNSTDNRLIRLFGNSPTRICPAFHDADHDLIHFMGLSFVHRVQVPSLDVPLGVSIDHGWNVPFIPGTQEQALVNGDIWLVCA